MRGEDSQRPELITRKTETPPRAWGRPGKSISDVMRQRNTPTCVGKTYVSVKAPKSYVKHPHVRGEDYSIMILERAKRETPPRAWGRLPKACACRARTWKHPHVRGEDAATMRVAPNHAETPPRAWGRRYTLTPTPISEGNTPTCVGKTSVTTP